MTQALEKMQGVRFRSERSLEAVLEEAVAHHAGRTAYLPGTLSFLGGTARLKPIRTTGSADLPAYSGANGLYVLPPDRERLEAGERVRVLILK